MNKSAAPVRIMAVYVGGGDLSNVETAPPPAP
jgi:hypothetical protein